VPFVCDDGVATGRQCAFPSCTNIRPPQNRIFCSRACHYESQRGDTHDRKCLRPGCDFVMKWDRIESPFYFKRRRFCSTSCHRLDVTARGGRQPGGSVSPETITKRSAAHRANWHRHTRPKDAFTYAQVRQIRQLVGRGRGPAEIARLLDRPYDLIYAIARGKTYRHVPGPRWTKVRQQKRKAQPSWSIPKPCAGCPRIIAPHANEHSSMFKKRRFCSKRCANTSSMQEKRRKALAPHLGRRCQAPGCNLPLVPHPREQPQGFRVRQHCNTTCSGRAKKGKPQQRQTRANPVISRAAEVVNL